jgi:translation elongation factor EF-G
MDSNQFFQSWLDRKLDARPWSLKKPFRATHEYKRNHGPRWSYAKVTIYAEPATTFSFDSRTAWPSDADRVSYEPYVIDAVTQSLFRGAGEAVLRVRLVLESAVVHEVDSNGRAFFEATLGALATIFRGDAQYGDNTELLEEI